MEVGGAHFLGFLGFAWVTVVVSLGLAVRLGVGVAVWGFSEFHKLDLVIQGGWWLEAVVWLPLGGFPKLDLAIQ